MRNKANTQFPATAFNNTKNTTATVVSVRPIVTDIIQQELG